MTDDGDMLGGLYILEVMRNKRGYDMVVFID